MAAGLRMQYFERSDRDATPAARCGQAMRERSTVAILRPVTIRQAMGSNPVVSVGMTCATHAKRHRPITFSRRR